MAQIVKSGGVPGNSTLLDVARNKDEQSRLRHFLGWLNETGQHYLTCEVGDYIPYLQEDGKADSTIVAYAATMRKVYERLSTNNRTRDMLFAIAEGAGMKDAPAFVNECVARMANNSLPSNSPVKARKIMHKSDEDDIRLNVEQLLDYINTFGVSTQAGLRNTGILCAMAAWGLRLSEVCGTDRADVKVRAQKCLWGSDTRKHLRRKPACSVRYGKGKKTRVVIDEQNVEVLREAALFVRDYATYLDRNGDVPIFSPFRSRHMTVLDSIPISHRTVQDLFREIPLVHDDHIVYLHPHRIRHSYARILYDSGRSESYIQEQLGHDLIATTQIYIGKLPDPRFES